MNDPGGLLICRRQTRQHRDRCSFSPGQRLIFVELPGPVFRATNFDYNPRPGVGSGKYTPESDLLTPFSGTVRLSDAMKTQNL